MFLGAWYFSYATVTVLSAIVQNLNTVVYASMNFLNLFLFKERQCLLLL